MAKESRKAGRPKSDSPKRNMIAFRIDAATAEALERRRERIGVLSFSLSDTVREIVLRDLKSEGLL